MTGEIPDPSLDLNYQQVLDDLIIDCYTAIKDSMKDNAKLGDLLKMIELRRKLDPENPKQKEFWKLMEQIRKEKLTSDKNEITETLSIQTAEENIES